MKSLMNTLSQNTKIDRNVAELLKKLTEFETNGDFLNSF